MEAHTNTLSHLVEAIEAIAANNDVGDEHQVTVSNIMAVVGRRAYGPLLLLVGLFSLSPATIVPGMTWFSAALTLLLSVQMMLGARHPWLPQRVLRARISRAAIRRACESLRSWARRIDAVLKPRLTALSEAPFVNVVGLFCAAAALATFPLGLIPLAPVAPGLAITLVGLGLFVRDGLLLLFGGMIVVGASALAFAAMG